MPRTRAAILAASAAAALLLSGCGFASPIRTLQTYSASDGVRVELADGVRVENLMVLTEAEGEAGQLLGAVVNPTEDDARVRIAVSGSATEVRVPAGDVVNLVDEADVVAAVAAPPGATIEASIEFRGTTTARIPVLDGTIPPYDEYLP